VVSEGTLTIPVRLWRHEAFWQESLSSYAMLSVYFGMLLALAAYNLLLWFSLRDHNYLTYVLFAISMAVGQLSLNGLGNQFLWPDWPVWGNLAFSTGFAATGFFGACSPAAFSKPGATCRALTVPSSASPVCLPCAPWRRCWHRIAWPPS
jgi:hypothetical protein